jgi:hypothetical protein
MLNQNQQHIEKRVKKALILAIQEKIRKLSDRLYYETLFKTFQHSDVLQFKHQYHALENQTEKEVQRVWESLIPKEFLRMDSNSSSNLNTKKNKKMKTTFWTNTFYNQLKPYAWHASLKTLYCTRQENDYNPEVGFTDNYYVLGMRECGDWFLMVVEDCLADMDEDSDDEEDDDEDWENWEEEETRKIEKFYAGMSAKEYEELPTKVHLYTHASLETLLFSIPSEYIKRLQLQKDVLKISKPVTTILNAEVGGECEQECPICMDALTKETQIKLSCGHLFCNPCIMKSIKTAKTTKKSEDMLTSCCPMCRGSVQAIQKSTVRLTQKLDKWCKQKHHLRLKLQGYQTVHRGRKN